MLSFKQGILGNSWKAIERVQEIIEVVSQIQWSRKRYAKCVKGRGDERKKNIVLTKEVIWDAVNHRIYKEKFSPFIAPLCIDKKADIMEGRIWQGENWKRVDSRFKRNLNRDKLECLMVIILQPYLF